MNLDFLLQAVKDVLQQHQDPEPSTGIQDKGSLFGKIEGLFGQHAAATGQHLPSLGNVRPASEDRYGDPADQEIQRFGHIKSASEDPYGDPADQERR